MACPAYLFMLVLDFSHRDPGRKIQDKQNYSIQDTHLLAEEVESARLWGSCVRWPRRYLPLPSLE
jgi:hypothetical protein